MSLKEEAVLIAKEFERLQGNLCYNAEAFDIFEGNLAPYVEAELKAQFSEKTFEIAKGRLAPINLLRRLDQKLSTLYAKPPTREIKQTPSDINLVNEYIKAFNLEVQGQIANEFFNLFKSFAWEPYLDTFKKPKLRAIPSDRFFVLSTDSVDPMRVTHFIKVMGKKTLTQYSLDANKKQVATTRDCVVLHVYTDREFIIQDEKGMVLEEEMGRLKIDGKNPYGKIPFVYSVRSTHHLMPVLDTDLLKMVKLFPILFTDLNYAQMFSSFSILYGIDVDETENLTRSPSVFWQFKSDPKSQKEPKIGTIKPEVDSDKTMTLIMGQMAIWLQSRNIRPGAIGTMSPENFVSGASKMVDEIDTSEDRNKQVPFFEKAEYDLFQLLKVLHPVWIREPNYFTKSAFSPSMEVITKFPEQKPVIDRGALIDQEVKMIEKQLSSKLDALKVLFPDVEEKDLKKRLADAAAENKVQVEVEAENQGDELNDGDKTSEIQPEPQGV